MTDLYQLSEEHEMVLDTVRKVVQDVAEPQALDCDEHSRFARAGFDELAELGLLGAVVGEDAGGAGLGLVSLVVAVEELAKGCSSTARLFLGQAGVCACALEGLEAFAEHGEALMMGEKIFAWVGPEHGISVAAQGDGFVLQGEAGVVTAAGEAGVLLVAARSADGEAMLFAVPAESVRIQAVPSLGFRACAPASIGFDTVELPADSRVAAGDDAEAAIRRAGEAGSVGSAAIGLGMAASSIELSRRHAQERIAFGKPLVRQQAVRHKLVESRRRLEAARALTWQAARRADAGGEAGELAALARLSGVDAALHAADEGIQIHGGFGYTVEYHVERHYRDAKTLEVLDGGSNAQRDALML